MILLGRLDTRALGAIELIDAITGRRASAPLQVRGDGVRIVRNRQGLHAIVAAPGLAAYAATFDLDELDAPPAPLSLEYALEIMDPSGMYLPRRATIRLPRDPVSGAPGSIVTPVPLHVFRAPAAATAVGWSLLRATVLGVDQALGPDDPIPADARTLPWVRILVTEAPDPDGGAEPPRPLARAMTDHRGEALIGIPGVPRFTWAEGDDDDTIIKPTSSVRVELAWDPRGDAGGWVPDPDVPDDEIADLKIRTLTLEVLAGKERNAVFTIVI